MTIERSFQKTARLSLVTSIGLALFWIGYYLTKGQVPVATGTVISKWLVFEPSFGKVLRWWDILIGPIFSALFIFLLSYWKEFYAKKTLAGTLLQHQLNGLLISSLVGLAISLKFGVVYGLLAMAHLIIISSIVFGFVSIIWDMPKIIRWVMVTEKQQK